MISTRQVQAKLTRCCCVAECVVQKYSHMSLLFTNDVAREAEVDFNEFEIFDQVMYVLQVIQIFSAFGTEVLQRQSVD